MKALRTRNMSISIGRHRKARYGLIQSCSFQERLECLLHISFAPLDIPHPKTVDGLTALFEEYNFPSDFVSERIQSVTQSFGTRMDENGTQCSWLHFLCKNINTIYENGVLKIQNPPPSLEQSGKIPQQSQADFSWIRAGFMLKSEQLKRQPNPGNKSTSSSSSSTRTHVNNSVTLICFGAPRSLVDRFENLAEDSGCEDALQDPYVLFDLVLDELYKLVDDIAWRLSEIFGKIESNTLYIADILSKSAGQTAYESDFAGLHNVAKHVIYLLETSESALLTAESLCASHKQLIGDNPNAPSASTQSSLLYRKGLFQSTQRRLVSLDRRMENIIGLSFNLVTLLDSRAIQKDSKSMKTIAFMTMFFLPVSTVATIFGAQFFTVGSEAPSHLQISPDFWILWAIAAPFTLVVVIVWRLWHLKATNNLVKGQQPHRGAGAVVLGWKAWLEKMGKRKKYEHIP
ncbi:uncharacterized protein K441DRAFT_704722 [Cenococcum geophilum 1.58]|uniref:uncharacterized protein n=1 Tax=Cenococcum geophilum 1.58 TaxID=794803 RepID=UPI00358F2F6A|nr:hypothetical protein K441DRAFT_704722 [Cenococcum geophilum 1.58]